MQLASHQADPRLDKDTDHPQGAGHAVDDDTTGAIEIDGKMRKVCASSSDMDTSSSDRDRGATGAIEMGAIEIDALEADLGVVEAALDALAASDIDTAETLTARLAHSKDS